MDRALPKLLWLFAAACFSIQDLKNRDCALSCLHREKDTGVYVEYNGTHYCACIQYYKYEFLMQKQIITPIQVEQSSVPPPTEEAQHRWNDDPY